MCEVYAGGFVESPQHRRLLLMRVRVCVLWGERRVMTLG